MKVFTYNKNKSFSVTDDVFSNNDKSTYGLIPASIERKGNQGVGEQFYKPSEAKHRKSFKNSDSMEKEIKSWKEEFEKKDNTKYLLGFLQTEKMTGKPDEFVVVNE